MLQQTRNNLSVPREKITETLNWFLNKPAKIAERGGVSVKLFGFVDSSIKSSRMFLISGVPIFLSGKSQEGNICNISAILEFFFM